ncbi:MAG: DUF1361 domain-containing protein [Chitinophagaceae bacterium]|jgi:uncharacterized membrane protein|nr:DUF1361 domain-containing protein [Chitinophagaceae bacterium]
MIKKLSGIEKMLVLSVGFTMTLLITRVWYTQAVFYLFYVWNIFLAIIPLLIANRLKRCNRLHFGAIVLLLTWLFFYPNAPYLITDLFHYKERLPVPVWYDLMLVISAAWNGLILGMVSLTTVEQFLSKHLKPLLAKSFVFVSFGLCGYGVYLGRYLRYNTWDIVAKPGAIMRSSAHQILHPHQNMSVWIFTLLFSSMLCIIYFTIKQSGEGKYLRI